MSEPTDLQLEGEDLESAQILEATLELAIKLLRDPKIRNPRSVPAGVMMVSLHLLAGPGGFNPR